MNPIRIGLLNLDCVINQTELPVLLVFGGMWDFESRVMYGELNTIAKKYDGKLITGIVDYDYVPDIFSDYEVYDIPTVMIFEDGKIFKRKFCDGGLQDIRNMLDHFFGVLPY